MEELGSTKKGNAIASSDHGALMIFLFIFLFDQSYSYDISHIASKCSDACLHSFFRHSVCIERLLHKSLQFIIFVEIQI